jgi:hypothetical protein
VQRYDQMADYARLSARIAELRAGGHSMAEVAACLNREGFHPPKRAVRFSTAMAAGFLAEGGRSGPRPRALSTAGMLKKGEWLLSDRARRLGMPPATLHSWRQLGWVQARKLPVPGGHWAIGAAGSELKRLTRLRQLLTAFPQAYQQHYPANLTAEGQPRQRAVGAGCKGRLEQPEDKLLFLLVYLKTYPRQAVLGELFGLSTSTVAPIPFDLSSAAASD